MRLDAWIRQGPPKGEGSRPKEERPRPEARRRVEAPAQSGDIYLLVSADYDPEAKATVLKLYNIRTHRIYLRYDDTGHKPYAFSKEPVERLKQNPEITKRSDKIIGFEVVKKHDPIRDVDIEVSKIVVDDPLVIGGTSTSLRNFIKLWEADIKYYANYIFDMGLNVGKYYRIVNGRLEEVTTAVDPKVQEYLEKYSGDEQVVEWVKLLAEPVPNYKLLAVDIEVYVPDQTRMPQPENPRDPIFIFSLMGSDGLKKVLLYNFRKEKVEARGDFEIEEFDDEKKMIIRAMEIMRQYPIIVTFNGDNFDMRYIRRRAEYLGIGEAVRDIIIGKNDTRVAWGVHLDLYHFFKNTSIRNYAFEGRYDEISLDAVGRSLVGMGKIEIQEGFERYSLSELCEYSFRDAEITYRLATFNNQLVMKLMTIIARIANMTMDDVCRLSVSNWIRNRMIDLHRKKGYLIPRPEEIREKGGERHFEPITKGKKYKGAIVVTPKAGVHFNVYVLDFASLYPSIMKEHNISYETVNCPHPECRDNKVPGTTTWVCRLKRGIASEFVGSIRDVRVNIFKKLSKDPSVPGDMREFYNVVQNALKVFINASYGVFGAEEFFLFYLPAAEAVTTLGRYAITVSIEEAKKLGLEVIYGDTDSLFIKNPDPRRLEELIARVRERLKLQLEVDKVYRYVVFSQRKKNYFGVLMDGTIDVKGLIGKKSSTPEFIKKVFYRILERLKDVNSEEDFARAKEDIEKIIAEAEEKIRTKNVDVREMAISVTLSKPLSEYTKMTPQHVKAAKLLEHKLGRVVTPGTIIKYVKTTDQYGVKPVELVKSPKEIDSEKYLDLLWSTITQITDALDIEKRGSEASKSLDAFFT